MEVFEYDENVSFEQNFIVWYDMNCRERSAWNEKQYTVDKYSYIGTKTYNILIIYINDFTYEVRFIVY